MRSDTDRPPTAAQQERSGVCACTCIGPGTVSSLKANHAHVDISWQQHMSHGPRPTLLLDVLQARMPPARQTHTKRALTLCTVALKLQSAAAASAPCTKGLQAPTCQHHLLVSKETSREGSMQTLQRFAAAAAEAATACCYPCSTQTDMHHAPKATTMHPRAQPAQPAGRIDAATPFAHHRQPQQENAACRGVCAYG